MRFDARVPVSANNDSAPPDVNRAHVVTVPELLRQTSTPPRRLYLALVDTDPADTVTLEVYVEADTRQRDIRAQVTGEGEAAPWVLVNTITLTQGQLAPLDFPIGTVTIGTTDYPAPGGHAAVHGRIYLRKTAGAPGQTTAAVVVVGAAA